MKMKNFKNYNRNKRKRTRKSNPGRIRISKKVLLPLILVVLVAIIVFAILLIRENRRVYREYTIEAGSVVEVGDFLKIKDDDAYFTVDSEDYDASVPGEYHLCISSGWFVHDVTLIVEDTTAPVFEVQDIECWTNGTKEISPEQFVKSSEDVTPVTYSYETAPDMAAKEAQTVVIIATDTSGNESRQSASLKLKLDKQSPEVYAYDFVGYLEEAIVYKDHIKAVDNSGDSVEIMVDTSEVEAEKVGIYPVTYTATDRAGNATSVTVELTIKKHVYSMETLNERCQAVIDEIITADMTKAQQVRAVYNWIRENIEFIYVAEKDDWVETAYLGFERGRGNCYTYACIAKGVFNLLDIKNMDIEMIPQDGHTHYWNLIDIDDGHGWYHFDAMPWNGGYDHCMVTDEVVQSFGRKAVVNYYNYDRNRYPEVK